MAGPAQDWFSYTAFFTKNPRVNPLLRLDHVTETVVKPVDLSWARGLDRRQRPLAENEEGASSGVEVERRGHDVPEEHW